MEEEGEVEWSDTIDNIKNNVPKFVQRADIDRIYDDIKDFLSGTGSFAVCNHPNLFTTKLKEEELKKEQIDNLVSYIKNEDSEIFSMITKLKNAAGFILHSLPISSFEKIYSKKYFNEVQSIAVFSNNVAFLQFALQKIQQKTGLFTKKDVSEANKFIIQRFDLTPFDWKQKYYSIPHKIGQIISSTSFTANESHVYIGCKDNKIRILSLPGSGSDTQIGIISYGEGGKQYSMTVINDSLLIASRMGTKIIDLKTNRISDLRNVKMPQPICSDGRYIYAMHCSNKEIHIYQMTEYSIKEIKSVKLQMEETIPVSEFAVAFMCDGAFVTFSYNHDNHIIKHVHSIITGKRFCPPKSLPTKPAINGMAICPLSGDIVVLTDNEISLYANPLMGPRWAYGIDLPQPGEPNTLFPLLDYYAYCGYNMFYDSDENALIQFIQSYQNNPVGLNFALQLFMRQSFGKYERSNKFLIELSRNISKDKLPLLLSVFFSWVRNMKENERAPDENIANVLLRSSGHQTMIVFSDCIDFIRFKMNKETVVSIIVYVTSRYMDFPRQCQRVLLNFMQNYLKTHIMKKKFGTIVIVIDNITGLIKEHINDRDFEKSGIFELWATLLQVIGQLKGKWGSHSQQLCKSLFMLVIESNVPEIMLMSNRTLFMAYFLAFSAPYRPIRTLYKSVDEFYKENPHPLNRKDPAVDAKLFHLVNNAYDVKSKAELAETFFKLRRFVIFEYTGAAGRLNMKTDNRAFSLEAVRQMVMDGSTSGFIPVEMNIVSSSDHIKGEAKKVMSPMELLLNENSKQIIHNTQEQEIIIFGFYGDINSRSAEIASVPQEIIISYVTAFNNPILLPIDVLRKSCLMISASNLLDFPVEVMPQETLKDLPEISDPRTLIKNFNDFTIKEEATQTLRKCILWHLYIDRNGIENAEMTIGSAIDRMIFGTPRVVSMVCRGLCRVTKFNNVDVYYKRLTQIVSHFVINGKNPFLNQLNPYDILESFFWLTNTLKSLYGNPKSGYSEFVHKYLKENPRAFPAICAILNDVFDTLRVDAKAHIIMLTGEVVKGIISDVSREKRSFKINGEEYLLNDTRKQWFYPPTNVILDQTDFNLFAELFEKDDYEDNTQKVFVSASFLAFLKQKKFASIDKVQWLIKDIYSVEKFKDFGQGTSVNDFLCFLSESRSPLDPFTFGSKEDQLYIDKKAIALNTEPPKPYRKEASFSTLAFSKCFASSPLHPRVAQRLRLCVSGQESFLKPTLKMRIIFYDNNTPTRFEVPEQTVSTSNGNHVIDIETHPRTNTITLKIDNEVIEDLYISPSASFFFVFCDVCRLSLIKYSLVQLPFEEYNPECGVSLPKCVPTSLERDLKPLADCREFIESSLVESSNEILHSLRLYITAVYGKELSAYNYFALLGIINPMPLSETFTMEKFERSELWLNASDMFIESTSKRKVPKIDEVLPIFKDFVENVRMISGGRHVTMLSNDSVCETSNCMIISPDSTMPMKLSTVDRILSKVSNVSMVVQYGDVRGTFLDMVILMRHSMLCGSDCLQLISLCEQLINENQFFQKYFGKIIELIQAVFISPADDQPNAIINVSNSSFLIGCLDVKPIHIISKAINKAKKQNLIDGPPFKVEMKPPFLLAIIGPPKAKFYIEHSNGKREQLSGGHFTQISESSSVDIRPMSSMTDLGKYTYVTCEVPAADLIADELKNWRIWHSQQISQDMRATSNPTDFGKLPLASEFSIETARFISQLLEESTHLSLVAAHVSKDIQVARGVSFDTGAGEEEDPLRCLIGPNTRRRINYFRKNRLSLFSVVEPFHERFERLPPQRFALARTQPKNMFITQSRSRETMSLLHEFVRNCNDITLLMFIEYCTGRFGMQSLESGGKIAVEVVEEKGVIKAFPASALLTIGSFENREAFRKAALEAIEKSTNELYSSFT